MSDPILDAFDSLCARRAADALVVSPGRRASVGEIDALAHHFTRGWAQAPPARGSLVALAAPNGPAFLAGFLALRRAGCSVLLVDRRSPAAERLRVARHLGAAAVLQPARAWPEDDSGAPLLAVAGLAAKPFEPTEPGGEIAVVKLTSGSTGLPRGILTRAEALVADDRALAATMGLGGAEERILAAIPMSHSYGLSSVVLPALMRGSTLVVPEDGDPMGALRAARWGDVTFLPTVPAYLRSVLKLREPPPLPQALRLVITAGAPLEPRTAGLFRRLYGLPVRVFYGASECGGICFDREGTAGERGTLGTPVEGVEVRLAGAEGGGPGVVTVRSAALSEGYFPETDQRLGGGRFETSDLATFEGGELMLQGRTDDLINVRGKKVNPREVEALIARHEGVEEVAVFGVPAPEGGGESVRAAVAGIPGRLCCERLRRHCRDHLAEHKVPRSWILLPELPRTARGKLDRRALLDLEPASGAGLSPHPLDDTRAESPGRRPSPTPSDLKGELP